MWPVLANQLGSRRAQFRAAEKRLDKSSAFKNGRLAISATLPSSSSDKNFRDFSSMPPPWGAEPKLEFKGGWLKRIAQRNNIQKFFLRAQ